MVSLYTTKSSNLRRSVFLITGFLVFVILFGWLLSSQTGNDIYLYVAVVYAIGSSLVSYFYSDKIVLGMYRAQPVTMQTNPELYRIVENLSITTGIPMPKLYIVSDPAPNAFATGRNYQHAAVAVTSGLLGRLDKSELEGVLAHELSHVINRDTLVSTIVVILVSVVATASNLFLRSLYFSNMSNGRDRDRGNLSQVLFILTIVGALLAPFAAVLIQLAVSRRREFLADSNGALITRYPEGLANALIKISQSPVQLQHINNQTAHLWFDNPFKGKAKTTWFYKLFMTHPPVEERVKALLGK